MLTTTWTVGAAPTIHPPALEEDDEGELLRITLPRTPLNKGKKKGQSLPR